LYCFAGGFLEALAPEAVGRGVSLVLFFAVALAAGAAFFLTAMIAPKDCIFDI